MKEQVKKIYEAIADKTLNFGCRITEVWDNKMFRVTTKYRWNGKKYEICYAQDFIPHYIWSLVFDTELGYKEKIKIIGHPVMIGDVLEYLHKNIEELWYSNVFEVIQILCYRDEYNSWKDKRKPIEDQSQECIDFVESLILKR